MVRRVSGKIKFSRWDKSFFQGKKDFLRRRLQRECHELTRNFYLLLLFLCLASTLGEMWNNQPLQDTLSGVVHPDQHGTATQIHSAAHSSLGGSVARTAEELCLMGHQSHN